MVKKIKTNHPVYVTKPFLGNLNDYNQILEEIWDNKILTNRGKFVNEFEEKFILKFLCKHFLTFMSGTMALNASIMALKIKGEIITSPFTWIATISAIKLSNCIPVFGDINCETLNLDASKIEKYITSKTCAIMPVHVFGNPCEINEIQELANKYNLKVIYDAAHAVGSKYKNKSILNYGDISATSFHATKLLNTGGEGGGCITNSKNIAKRLKRIQFFGYNEDKTDILLDGMNGKLNELQSGVGIINLIHFDKIINDRKIKYKIYYDNLVKNKKLSFQKLKTGETNFSYFPIIFKTENELLKIVQLLNQENIFPRRYFYPSVNKFNKIIETQKRELSESIAKRILCLPLYFDLDVKIIIKVIQIINKNL
tara:strand:+ start:2817 stop:3926 length:1110 start_codon:yes stop_codon:yes gene_type:complete